MYHAFGKNLSTSLTVKLRFYGVQKQPISLSVFRSFSPTLFVRPSVFCRKPNRSQKSQNLKSGEHVRHQHIVKWFELIHGERAG